MRYLLIDTYHLFIRHLRASLRMPIWIIFNILQPMIWLVLYGQLFKSMVLLPGFPTGSYLQFFAPGVITMTAFFGSAWAGMAIIQDIDHGVINKLLTTPVNRVAIMFGRVLHTSLTAAIQALIVMFLASLLGAKVAGGFIGVVLIALVAMLVGIIFASFSNAMAILLKKEESVIAVLEFVLMPFMFLSTIMIPDKFMPVWIFNASKFNPVNWTVNIARTLMIDGLKWAKIIPNLELLLMVAVFSVLVATFSFRIVRE